MIVEDLERGVLDACRRHPGMGEAVATGRPGEVGLPLSTTTRSSGDADCSAVMAGSRKCSGHGSAASVDHGENTASSTSGRTSGSWWSSHLPSPRTTSSAPAIPTGAVSSTPGHTGRGAAASDSWLPASAVVRQLPTDVSGRTTTGKESRNVSRHR